MDTRNGAIHMAFRRYGARISLAGRGRLRAGGHEQQSAEGYKSTHAPHIKIMSKFSRGASAWKEHRIADTLTADGVDYTVQLVARRGTGFQGYRVTLHFIPHSEGDEVQLELENASSTADVHRVARELSEDRARVEQLFRQAGNP